MSKTRHAPRARSERTRRTEKRAQACLADAIGRRTQTQRVTLILGLGDRFTHHPRARPWRTKNVWPQFLAGNAGQGFHRKDVLDRDMPPKTDGLACDATRLAHRLRSAGRVDHALDDWISHAGMKARFTWMCKSGIVSILQRSTTSTLLKTFVSLFACADPKITLS